MSSSRIFTEVTDKIFLIYDRILYSLSCRSSYTHSSDSDSEDQEDETLKAIRVNKIKSIFNFTKIFVKLYCFQNAQRAKELRAKFEEWEDSQDAKDQMAQMSAYDENGEPLETASILRRKFEALRMHEEKANATPPPIKAQFRPKRFKVREKYYDDE